MIIFQNDGEEKFLASRGEERDPWQSSESTWHSIWAQASTLGTDGRKHKESTTPPSGFAKALVLS